MKNKKETKAKTLPYYGKPGFLNSLKTSSKIRNHSTIRFFFNRLNNRILEFFAFFCPINSWRIQFHRWRGVNIGERVFIGLHVIIDRTFPEYITLEDDSMIAGGNHLLAHSRAPEFYKGKLLSYVAPITLKQYSWLGINSIILPGSTIGKGSVVTAGSVVSGTIPDNVIVQGNPAAAIKHFEGDNGKDMPSDQ